MEQMIVTIGPKSQVVIPKSVRKVVRGIKPGGKVVVRPLTSRSVIVEVSTDDWVKRSYGLMKNAWRDIDPIKELEKLRNEWERKG